jgi:hypothetical protein
MRKVTVALFGLMLVGAVGCTKDSNGKMHPFWDKDKKPTTQESMSASSASAKDDCPMCPGTQTAKADGTCPKCGMKVK